MKKAEMNQMNKQALKKIRSGKFIYAIRLVRDKTGWGLKESKEYCDKLRQDDRAETQTPKPVSEIRGFYSLVAEVKGDEIPANPPPGTPCRGCGFKIDPSGRHGKFAALVVDRWAGIEIIWDWYCCKCATVFQQEMPNRYRG